MAVTSTAIIIAAALLLGVSRCWHHIILVVPDIAIVGTVALSEFEGGGKDSSSWPGHSSASSVAAKRCDNTATEAVGGGGGGGNEQVVADNCHHHHHHMATTTTTTATWRRRRSEHNSSDEARRAGDVMVMMIAWDWREKLRKLQKIRQLSRSCQEESSEGPGKRKGRKPEGEGPVILLMFPHQGGTLN
ncbi:hypothetical protein V8E53_002176 [Lactarius tabidus]